MPRSETIPCRAVQRLIATRTGSRGGARPASYGIWRASESGMIRRFEQAGVICKRVMIDPSELALFAAHNGMAVDSACRLAFAEWTMRAETGLDAGAGERDFPKTIHTV